MLRPMYMKTNAIYLQSLSKSGSSELQIYGGPRPFSHDFKIQRTTFQGSGLGRLILFMPPKELWEAYSNRTVCPSVSPSVRPSRFRVQSISPTFFEVGITNLVSGYILGWRSVAYHFRVNVTLTLTSDPIFRIIVSGAYLLYYLR